MRQPHPHRHRIITLLTDFGTIDPYVAMMKGVMLELNPDAVLVDISHEVAPQNVLQAAFMLFHSYRYFPTGTIHVAVVDPGVGTSRRAILMVTPDAFFLSPDNGLLSYIVSSKAGKKAGLHKVSSSMQAFSLTRKEFWRKEVSQTFHGRDIFATVAAHLSLGVKPEVMGKKIESLLVLPLPGCRHASSGVIYGEVIYIDRFGNLVTSIPSEKISSGVVIIIAGQEIRGLSSSYEGKRGLLAIIGSLGNLEIAYKNGSAAEFLKVNAGEKILLRKYNNLQPL